jgi:hypothetical protein
MAPKPAVSDWQSIERKQDGRLISAPLGAYDERDTMRVVSTRYSLLPQLTLLAGIIRVAAPEFKNTCHGDT